METKQNLTKMMESLRFDNSKEMPKGRRNNSSRNTLNELGIEVL